MAPAMVAAMEEMRMSRLPDVGQFVGHDPSQFVAVEDPHDAGCGGDRRVLGVAPGGEGVRGVRLDDVDLGHRQPACTASWRTMP